MSVIGIQNKTLNYRATRRCCFCRSQCLESPMAFVLVLVCAGQFSLDHHWDLAFLDDLFQWSWNWLKDWQVILEWSLFKKSCVIKWNVVRGSKYRITEIQIHLNTGLTIQIPIWFSYHGLNFGHVYSIQIMASLTNQTFTFWKTGQSRYLDPCRENDWYDWF